MAHWAELNNSNIVLRVIVTSNEEPDEGYQWIIDNLGGRWVKTSYNTINGIHTQGGIPFRKNYAGVGFLYDEQRDAFIPPKPESLVLQDGSVIDYVLDEETCNWKLDESQE